MLETHDEWFESRNIVVLDFKRLNNYNVSDSFLRKKTYSDPFIWCSSIIQEIWKRRQFPVFLEERVSNFQTRNYVTI